MKALITGASSGIGRDMAKELSKRGYDLVLVARDLDKLEKVKKELTTNAEIECIDVSKKENCITLYNKYPNVDIVINNAGFGDCGDFDKTDINKDINMIETNIIAYHILTKLYLKSMIERNSGKILNVASIAGFMPGPLMTTYYATKGYVVRMSEAIREELRRRKSAVQISILCPGPVNTNFNNVANVQFSLAGQTSDYVARYTIDKFLKGKFYIVPEFSIKCVRIFSKLLSNKTLAKICYNSQKRKIYKHKK